MDNRFNAGDIMNVGGMVQNQGMSMMLAEHGLELRSKCDGAAHWLCWPAARYPRGGMEGAGIVSP